MRPCADTIDAALYAMVHSHRNGPIEPFKEAALGGEMIKDWMKLTADMALLGLGRVLN